MTMYRLCLLGPTGKIAKVRRFWASTDEGALAMTPADRPFKGPLAISTGPRCKIAFNGTIEGWRRRALS